MWLAELLAALVAMGQTQMDLALMMVESLAVDLVSQMDLHHYSWTIVSFQLLLAIIKHIRFAIKQRVYLSRLAPLRRRFFL